MRYQLSLFFILFFTLYSNAQLATVNSKTVLESIPQIKKADTLLAQEQQRLSQEYQQLRYKTQIQLGKADSLYRLKPKDSNTLQEISKAKKMNEELAESEKKINKKLSDYYNVLMTPYFEKIDLAIQNVATRKKILQVIDIQKVAFVYISPLGDITEEVIKELKAKK